jgi:hypothetical protein
MSRIPGLRWDCWPEPDDLLLLRSILHRDDGAAADAWGVVATRLDLDAPSSEQYRLYPLLADRLARLPVDEPRLGMLQGVRRQAAIQTLLRLRHLDTVLDVLDAGGVHPLLLKGPALALTVYPDVGLRPFDDVDLLVGRAEHARAVAVLESAGWRVGAADFDGNHAVPLVGGPVDVDLHRTLNRELVIPGEPDATWSRLRQRPVGRPLPSGRTVTTLDLAEHLVHTTVHGTQWGGPVNLRWVADTVRLVDAPDLDWDHVVDLSHAFGVAAVVHDSLVLVRETAGIEVPAAELARLGGGRTSPFARLRTRAFHQQPRTDGWTGGLPRTVAVHLRRTRDQSLSGVLRSAPAYLCDVWEVDRPRQLPGVIVRRARHR